jgi:hypothetical protein
VLVLAARVILLLSLVIDSVSKQRMCRSALNLQFTQFRTRFFDHLQQGIMKLLSIVALS